MNRTVPQGILPLLLAAPLLGAGVGLGQRAVDGWRRRNSSADSVSLELKRAAANGDNETVQRLLRRILSEVSQDDPRMRNVPLAAQVPRRQLDRFPAGALVRRHYGGGDVMPQQLTDEELIARMEAEAAAEANKRGGSDAGDLFMMARTFENPTVARLIGMNRRFGGNGDIFVSPGGDVDPTAVFNLIEELLGQILPVLANKLSPRGDIFGGGDTIVVPDVAEHAGAPAVLVGSPGLLKADAEVDGHVEKIVGAGDLGTALAAAGALFPSLGNWASKWRDLKQKTAAAIQGGANALGVVPPGLTDMMGLPATDIQALLSAFHGQGSFVDVANPAYYRQTFSDVVGGDIRKGHPPMDHISFRMVDAGQFTSWFNTTTGALSIPENASINVLTNGVGGNAWRPVKVIVREAISVAVAAIPTTSIKVSVALSDLVTSGGTEALAFLEPNKGAYGMIRFLQGTGTGTTAAAFMFTLFAEHDTAMYTLANRRADRVGAATDTQSWQAQPTAGGSALGTSAEPSLYNLREPVFFDFDSRLSKHGQHLWLDLYVMSTTGGGPYVFVLDTSTVFTLHFLDSAAALSQKQLVDPDSRWVTDEMRMTEAGKRSMDSAIREGAASLKAINPAALKGSGLVRL